MAAINRDHDGVIVDERRAGQDRRECANVVFTFRFGHRMLQLCRSLDVDEEDDRVCSAGSLRNGRQARKGR